MIDPFRMTTRRSEPSLRSALAATDDSIDLESSGENIPTPTHNPPAFAHNAAFPPAVSKPAIPEHLRNIPDFKIRKPSASGLHIRVDPNSNEQQLARGVDRNNTGAVAFTLRDNDSTNNNTWPAAGQELVSRTSWESGGSPGSTVSTTSLGALGDLTPLPSPLTHTWPSDIWSRANGRPHSASSASIERDRAAGLLSPVPQASPPQKRKKVYGDLGSSPPSQTDNRNGTPERDRALSDFVPEQLTNTKPRIVTGPIVLPPPSQPVTAIPDQKSPLHRELFLARPRQSVDLSKTLDPLSLLPSPPPSTHTSSETESDTSGTHLTIRDSITHKTTHWKTIRCLGTGTFSEVMLATPDTRADSLLSINGDGAFERGSLVAIKIVSHNPSGAEDEERMDTSIHREIEILQTVSHPSLPRLYAFENNETQASLVLNYCSGGDLFDLASQRREHVTPPLIQRIFAELIDATLYLHSLLIVHRDIKLENVLVNISLSSLPLDPIIYPHPIVTLTDLGLSKHLPPPPESPLLTHPCGSVDYAAPELLLGLAYDGRQTDAWALGVLLYSLMEGRLPFDLAPNAKRRGQNNVKHRIARCDWLWCEYGDEYGDWQEDNPRAQEMQGAREIVEGLLKKVNRGRWSLEKVKETDWVRNGMRVPGGLRVP